MAGGTWVALGLGSVVWMALGAAQPQPESLVRVRMASENAELVPGRDNWLALDFVLEPHWHLYWDGRNDSGMPPTVDWTLPEGFKAGPIVWPAPKRHVLPGDLLDHVYEDRVTLLVPLIVPPTAKAGPVRVSGELRWLVCSDICLPGEGRVSAELTVAADPAGAPRPGADANLFAAARARVPKPPPKPTASDPGPVRVTWKAGEVELHAPGAEKLAFYPGHDCSPLRDIVADGEAKGDRIRIRLNTDHDGPVRLAGVLDVTFPKPRPASIWLIDLAPREGTDSGG